MIAFFIPFFFFFLAFYPTLHNASTIHTTTTTTTIDLIRYLQKEQTAVTSAQRDIIDFLHSKKISIGREPTHPILGQQDSISDDESSLKAHVAISTESHPIECRVTLGPAPPGLIEKFLVSKTFWQAYPHWSKIVSIPLALKIWLGKLVLQYLVEKYLWFEKTFLVDYLASLETSLIEESLPLDDLVKEED
eukprot:scaffold398_cov177-Ochromonas_danica.AAC.22